MNKMYVMVIVTIAVSIFIGSAVFVSLNSEPEDSTPVNYTYEVINVYPHDPNAFTQGLIIVEEVMFESTGLKGMHC